MFRLIVIIKFFICLFFISKSFSSELAHFKITTFTTKPKPSINATSIDNTTKWFDDNPSAESNKELEFGFYLPNNYGLSFRNTQINGIHLGEATKYVCILGYCSYVGAGIVTGNSTTDKISYEIDSWQIIVDKSYKFTDKVLLKPRLGINFLDTKLKYSGTGQNVEEKQIVPLPFTGFKAEFEINSNYTIYLDTNYFKYNQENIGVHYYDTSIGINKKVNKFINIFLGYKRYDLGISNKDGKSNIAFDIDQKTPFLGINLIY